MTNQPFICCVAGRSGGHIIPAHTYASQEYPHHPLLFFTTAEPLDAAIVKNFEPQAMHIPLDLPNLPSLKNPFSWLKFSWLLLKSFYQAFKVLKKNKPAAIISMGGYISIPVCLAGYLLRIPIVLFELNAAPGKATYYLAPLATSIQVCFKEALHYFSNKKTKLVPYPLKPSIRYPTLSSFEAKKQLLIPEEKITLLIAGGSQGSRMLNYIITNFVASHQDLFKDITILHQVGNDSAEPLRMWYKSIGITAHVFNFSTDMERIYLASDIIISRGGAGTLFEILALKKPSLIVPLTHVANNHQVANAQSMSHTYKEFFTYISQTELEKNQEPIITLIRQVQKQV